MSATSSQVSLATSDIRRIVDDLASTSSSSSEHPVARPPASPPTTTASTHGAAHRPMARSCEVGPPRGGGPARAAAPLSTPRSSESGPRERVLPGVRAPRAGAGAASRVQPCAGRSGAIPRLLPPPNPVARRFVAPPVRQIANIRPSAARAAQSNRFRSERQASRAARPIYKCKPCGIQCNSQITLSDHLSSRRHRNTVNRPEEFPRCKICERDFESGEHLGRHERGKHHRRTVIRLASGSR